MDGCGVPRCAARSVEITESLEIKKAEKHQSKKDRVLEIIANEIMV